LILKIWKHKIDAKTNPNRPIYNHLNVTGWNNIKIVLIEKYAFNDRDALHAREQYHIDLSNEDK
jgi:hypothetical protein